MLKPFWRSWALKPRQSLDKPTRVEGTGGQGGVGHVLEIAKDLLGRNEGKQGKERWG